MATLMDEFNDYYARLKDSVDFVLVKDVAPAIVDRIENMAGVNVYAFYDNELEAHHRQRWYLRRYSLLNDSAYDRSASNMTLEIDCTTTGNPNGAGNDPGWDGYNTGEIGDIITSGQGYHWAESLMYENSYPRPWMEPGLEDAINDHSAEQALEAGLEAMGF